MQLVFTNTDSVILGSVDSCAYPTIPRAGDYMQDAEWVEPYYIEAVIFRFDLNLVYIKLFTEEVLPIRFASEVMK